MQNGFQINLNNFLTLINNYLNIKWLEINMRYNMHNVHVVPSYPISYPTTVSKHTKLALT